MAQPVSWRKRCHQMGQIHQVSPWVGSGLPEEESQRLKRVSSGRLLPSTSADGKAVWPQLQLARKWVSLFSHMNLTEDPLSSRGESAQPLGVNPVRPGLLWLDFCPAGVRASTSESETVESVAICCGTIEQNASSKVEVKCPCEACRGLTRKMARGGEPGSDWSASLCPCFLLAPDAYSLASVSCTSTLGDVDTAGIQHLLTELASELNLLNFKPQILFICF